jgi:hypothetical protein
MGENQEDLDRVFVNFTNSASIHGKSSALTWALLVPLLVLDEECSSTRLRKRFSTSAFRLLSLLRSAVEG